MRLVRCLWLLVGCVLWAGCATAPPWASSRTMPLGDFGPLVDCAGVEAELCADGDGVALERRCLALAQDQDTEVTGSRCLAHLALERAKTLVILKEKTEPILDLELALQDQEATREQHSLQQRLAAIAHLDAAVAAAPDVLGLRLWRLELYAAVDAFTELGREILPVAAATCAHPERQGAQEGLQRLHALGYVAAEHEDYATAILIFQAMAEACPSFAPAQADLGALLMAQGEFLASQRVLEALLQAGPTQEIVTINRLLLDLWLTDLAAAEARVAMWAQRVETLTAERPLVLLLLCLSRGCSRELAALEPVVEEAMALPQTAWAWAEWSLSLPPIYEGLALAAALHAIRLDPLRPTPRVALARPFTRRGFTHKAWDVYRHYLEHLEREPECAPSPETTTSAPCLPQESLSQVERDQARLFASDAALMAGAVDDAARLLDAVETRGCVYDFLLGQVLWRRGANAEAGAAFMRVIAAPDAGNLAPAAQAFLDAINAELTLL